MATAAVTKTASPAQQTLDLRRKDLGVIETKYAAASNALEKILNDHDSEQRTIEAIDKQYHSACVAAARGDDLANPAGILAEKDRRAHRIKGLVQLLAEAKEAVAVLAPEFTSAQSAVVDAQNDLKLEELTAAITVADAEAKRTRTAFDKAAGELNVAIQARDKHRRQVELAKRSK